ncbi:MAG TPA: NUDIX domain-containing protein [Candidatus Paceibacterota bacterium]|nr:NUDIX domain-containing protein [Candidatus Paceibacterota bacterium]
MQKQSAGILLYRLNNDALEVFLVHLGGPFFANKDDGSWSIPKGEFDDSEAPLVAARREFFEETGFVIEAEAAYTPLSLIKTASGRQVYAFALEGDADPATLTSNTFEIEWPPRSGMRQSFPEVDRGDWFSIAEAKKKLQPAQIPLLDELLTLL